MMKRIALLFFICLQAMLLAPTHSHAQGSNLTIIVGYPPSGPTDLYARDFARTLQEQSGSTVTVINRPGQGGHTAAETLASGSAEPNTVLLHNSYFRSARAASLAPLAQIGETALGIWLSPLGGSETAQEAAQGRWRSPAKGSNGNNIAHPNTPAALAYIMANKSLFQLWLGGNVTPVAYNGAAPAMADAAQYGGLLVADLSSHEAAKAQNFKLIALSAPSLADTFGLPSSLGKLPGPTPLAVPIGIYAHPGLPAYYLQALRTMMIQAASNKEFQAKGIARYIAPQVRDSRYQNEMADQHNAFAKLAQTAIAKGATDLPQPYFLGDAGAVAATQPAPNQPSPSKPALTRDDPKVFGRSMRGG